MDIDMAAPRLWLAGWREMAVEWVRGKGDRVRWERVLGSAGPSRATLAQHVLDALLQAGWIVSDFKGQETVCGANGTWEAAGNTFTATMPKERHVRVSTRDNIDWGA